MLTAPVIHTVLAAGCLLFVVAVLMARHDYRNWGHELGAMSVWRIDRGHGQLFFKPTDFADQQPHAVHAVVRIIDAVHAIHTRPAADWVDAEQLRQLHHLAWDTLAQVHQCPSVHRDREPITDALELVATHVRLLNQRLTGLAAMNTIDAILADVAAVHGVLDPRPRLTGSDVGTQR
jgi:hypothetical protein